MNQVDDTGKEYWLKEAGSFKKYCEAIPVITNDNDLLEGIFGGHDIKDVFGICDYDAISFIHHNEEYWHTYFFYKIRLKKICIYKIYQLPSNEKLHFFLFCPFGNSCLKPFRISHLFR